MHDEPVDVTIVESEAEPEIEVVEPELEVVEEPEETVPNASINSAGVDLITRFESFSPTPYKDVAGVVTIGFGHTQGVIPARITEKEGIAYLIQDLVEAETAVKREVRVPLNENQFAALVSFTFNLGQGTLRKSTMLKKLNGGNFGAAVKEIEKFVNAGGQRQAGLLRRRAAEAQLFVTPPPMKSHIVLIPAEQAWQAMSATLKDDKGNDKGTTFSPEYQDSVAVLIQPRLKVYVPEEDVDVG